MDEVQYLDDELEGLVAEITEKYEDLKKTDKKLNVSQREDKIAYVQDRISRAKDVLANYRVELREVLRECGREEHAQFEAKGKAYNQAVNKLATDTEALKTAADKRELIKGAKKKKKGDQPEPDSKVVAINDGKKIQEKSMVALGRTSKMVEEMTEMGADTNINLKRQTEQMSNTNADVVGVQNEMKRASKVTRDIARRLATDKLIICLVLVLIIVVILVIVFKVLGWDITGVVCVPFTTGYENCTKTNGTIDLLNDPFSIIPGGKGDRKPKPDGGGNTAVDPRAGWICSQVLKPNCTMIFCNDTTTTAAPETTPEPETTPAPVNSTDENSTTTTTTTPEPITTPVPCKPDDCMMEFCYTTTPPPTTTPEPIMTTPSPNASLTSNSTNSTDDTSTDDSDTSSNSSNSSRRLLLLELVQQGSLS